MTVLVQPRTFLDGKVTLHGGDNRDVLKSIPDSSIDSVVTDPPYALVSITKRFGKPGSAPAKSGKSGVYARASAGFMGQQWDTGEVAFAEEFWAEILRVLKPGGHLVAFSGTRTYHRMTCAIEDAGFEVRDQLAWVYGCLSDDAEILTRTGWKRGIDVRDGEEVAAWDAVTGKIELKPVEKHTVAPYRGDLVRFANDNTDQLLTPNHRVYHRPRCRKMTAGVRTATYGETYEVAEAGAINRWNAIKLPLAGLHDGPGIGGEDYAALIGWVWTEGGFDKAPSTGVRVYQSESANAAKVAEIESLFARVLPDRKRYDREREYVYGNTVRAYTETCWFFTGELAQRVRADLPDKRPSWDLLWRMTLAEKRAFFDAAMKGDGSGDDFYQKDEASLVWFQALAATLGMRGKIVMRNAPRDGGSVCLTPRDTTELQARHLSNSSQPYDGLVWCVKVATGAFVARRKGKVFITGNSGFPKSLDVAKAIDKAARGVPQGVADPTSINHGKYRTIKTEGKRSEHDSGQGYGAGASKFLATGEHATAERELVDEAKPWNGWGTALKPSWEPICLARKPLIGTVAQNVLTHGTGALNIDGCRIEHVTVDGGNLAQNPHLRKGINGGNGGNIFPTEEDRRVVVPHAQGRFPANLCHDGSDEVVGCFPDSKSCSSPSSARPEGAILGGARSQGAIYPGEDGSAARFFYTSKAGADDRLGSKHPTVKPVDLMQWLVRLVTPKGGVTLDPFAGTGTTGEAAWREGMRAILIEREEEYQLDIARRMELAGNPTKRAAVAATKNNLEDPLSLPLFATLADGE